MITGDNSAKTVEGSGGSFSVPKEYLEAYKRAYRRRQRMRECGRRGHRVVYRRERDGVVEREVRVHVHSCGSVFCEWCNRRRFFEDFRRYEWYFKHADEISLVTLTMRDRVVCSLSELADAFSECIKALERLYQAKLFGKRVWPRWREVFERECRRFEERLGEEGRWRADRQRFFLLLFEETYKDKLKKSRRVGDEVFGLWRQEVTVRPIVVDGGVCWKVHFHWHGLVLGYWPKLLWQVLWKEALQLPETAEVIVDVRRVDGVGDLIVYLEKYLGKGLKVGEGVSEVEREEIELWLETVLYGKRLFRVWNLRPFEEGGDDGGWERECVLPGEGEFRERSAKELREVVREMKRKGEEEAFFDYMIFSVDGGVSEYPAYVRVRRGRAYLILKIPEEELRLLIEGLGGGSVEEYVGSEWESDVVESVDVSDVLVEWKPLKRSEVERDRKLVQDWGWVDL